MTTTKWTYKSADYVDYPIDPEAIDQSALLIPGRKPKKGSLEYEAREAMFAFYKHACFLLTFTPADATNHAFHRWEEWSFTLFDKAHDAIERLHESDPVKYRRLDIFFEDIIENKVELMVEDFWDAVNEYREAHAPKTKKKLCGKCAKSGCKRGAVKRSR